MASAVTKSRTCEHVYSVYGPQAGCAEFMTEPENFACADVAVVRLVFKHVAYSDKYQVVTEDNGIDLCATHAPEYRESADLVREIPLVETMTIEHKASGESAGLIMVSRFVDQACRTAIHQIKDASTGECALESMNVGEIIDWLRGRDLTFTPGSGK